MNMVTFYVSLSPLFLRYLHLINLPALVWRGKQRWDLTEAYIPNLLTHKRQPFFRGGLSTFASK